MFPSKADRILSRYRPIVPKPLPLPPSGNLATDLSSTCASLDSFTSCSKGRRGCNKRRAAPANLPSGKCPKLPKLEKAQVLPAISNTAGASASSEIEGNSDGIVPRCDSKLLGHVSRWNLGSFLASDIRVSMSMANGLPKPAVSSQMATARIPAPTGMANSIIETARSFLVADAATSQQQLAPSSLQCGSPAFISGLGAGAIAEKDVVVMEGACVKSPGHGGSGGFTELIRGITRLPTMADVESLMQSKSASPMAIAPELVGSCPGQEMSPCAQAVQQHLPLLHPFFPHYVVKIWEPTSHGDGLAMSALPRNVDGTLPLLPGVQSKISTVEHSQVETLNLFRDEVALDCPCTSGEDHPLSVGSCSEKFVVASPALTGQIDMLRHTDTIVNSGGRGAHPLAALPPMKSVYSVASTSSPFVRDDIGIDHVYLDQIYGSSTDPVLLLDQNNQALWSNKAYDRALKSACERSSHIYVPMGPYIDPLGHPTHLGSFLLNAPSKPANVTLWGFLKKLVMPEADTTPATPSALSIHAAIRDHFHEGKGFGACLSRGPLASSRWSDCVGNGGFGRLTMVTLENVTEVNMGEDAAILEPLEVVEAKLGALGSAPAFITDCTSRVRWMNLAFKNMLGSSESTSKSTIEEMKRTILYEPPELIFVGSVGKFPHAAWAFCGLVNLEWMKAGKRRSMMVPCDVSRLVAAAAWVWKFDLGLSLSLNLTT